MAHRIIATQNRVIYQADVTTPIVTLFEEQEVVTLDEKLKEALLSWGWAKPYDDTKPLPPKGIGIYEIGMIYQKDLFVLNGNALYQSKTITSNTWVLSEWNLILQGV